MNTILGVDSSLNATLGQQIFGYLTYGGQPILEGREETSGDIFLLVTVQIIFFFCVCMLVSSSMFCTLIFCIYSSVLDCQLRRCFKPLVNTDVDLCCSPPFQGPQLPNLDCSNIVCCPNKDVCGRRRRLMCPCPRFQGPRTAGGYFADGEEYASRHPTTSAISRRFINTLNCLYRPPLDNDKIPPVMLPV